MDNMLKSFFLLFVALFLNDVVSYDPLLTYVVRFKKITFHPNVSGHYTIDQVRENQFINGNISLGTKFIPDKVIAIFYRCTPEGYDCVFTDTWTFLDICNSLKEKNKIWSSWYGAFDPPMQCPINKVHYTMKNATFVVGPVIMFYPSWLNYHWRVTQKMYTGDEYIGGYTIDFYYFGYRKRTKSILKTSN